MKRLATILSMAFTLLASTALANAPAKVVKTIPVETASPEAWAELKSGIAALGGAAIVAFGETVGAVIVAGSQEHVDQIQNYVAEVDRQSKRLIGLTLTTYDVVLDEGAGAEISTLREVYASAEFGELLEKIGTVKDKSEHHIVLRNSTKADYWNGKEIQYVTGVEFQNGEPKEDKATLWLGLTFDAKARIVDDKSVYVSFNYRNAELLDLRPFSYGSGAVHNPDVEIHAFNHSTLLSKGNLTVVSRYRSTLRDDSTHLFRTKSEQNDVLHIVTIEAKPLDAALQQAARVSQ